MTVASPGTCSALFGCRVLDPQEETGPGDLGPAAGPYLIIFVQPDSDDLIDNVMYASEATPAQWAFERLLRNHIDGDEELTEARKTFLAQFSVTPYAMTHFGIAMNEAQQKPPWSGSPPTRTCGRGYRTPPLPAGRPGIG